MCPSCPLAWPLLGLGGRTVLLLLLLHRRRRWLLHDLLLLLLANAGIVTVTGLFVLLLEGLYPLSPLKLIAVHLSHLIQPCHLVSTQHLQALLLWRGLRLRRWWL